MPAAASASSNIRSNHNHTDCLADSLIDSCANQSNLELNDDRDNLCEELARTALSLPERRLAAIVPLVFTIRATQKLVFALRKKLGFGRRGAAGNGGNALGS